MVNISTVCSNITVMVVFFVLKAMKFIVPKLILQDEPQRYPYMILFNTSLGKDISFQ
jgi:hypothetical protein